MLERKSFELSKTILKQLQAEDSGSLVLSENDEAEVLPSALLVVNEDGIARFVSAAAGEILGRPVKSLLGSQIGVPLAAGKTTELDIVRPDGVALVAEFRAMRGLWETEEAWFLFLRDVTHRYAALEEAA